MVRVKYFLGKYSRSYMAIIFSAWGIYLRFLELAERDLWVDELASFRATEGALKPFWQNATYGSELISFPGQYLITWPFVRMFGLNKWGIMIPSVLSTLIGFYLLYLICQRYLKNSLSYGIVFALACFNHELIFHSFEFRPYSILPTLSLGVFYVADTIISQLDQFSLFKKFWAGVLLVFTTIYHAYGIIILFFIAGFLILRELSMRPAGEIFHKTWKFLGCVLLIAVPLFLWYAVGSKAVKGMMWMDSFEFIPNPLVDLVGFLKAVFCNLTGHRYLYFLFGGVILSFLISHKERFVQIGFFAVLVVMPIQILLLIDLNKSYWFLQRQFIWVTPLFIFLVGWCWDSIFNFWKGLYQRKLA